jgi:O-antigen/teichoic acid export membrane protein
MTKDPRHSRNSRWNYAEVLVSSLALFVLFKFLLIGLGLAAVGVWSIVVATTSLGRIADLGTAGGLGRYIAVIQADTMKSAAGRADETLIYVETALLFSTLLFAVVGAVLYWPAFYAIQLAVPASESGVVALLLPFSVASFVTMNITSVAMAALIGMHRSDLKSKMSMIGSVVQVAVAFALKDKMGITSLAVAQVIQNLVVLIGGWLIIQYLVWQKVALKVPWRFRKGPLRELAGFGLKLQLIAVLGLLSEPAIKFVLSLMGGLATVGMYELVTKGIVLVRQFVIAPTPNLVPIFASAAAEGPDRLARAYSEATSTLAVSGGFAMALMAVAAPLISVMWLGTLRADFVVYSAIMAAGYAVNIICIPSLSVAIATGQLGWNVLGNLVTLVIGPILAVALGTLWHDPTYLIAARSLSIAMGALVTAALTCRQFNISLLPELAEYRAAMRGMVPFRRG